MWKEGRVLCPHPSSSNMAIFTGGPLRPAKHIWPDIPALQLLQRGPLILQRAVYLKGHFQRSLLPPVQLKHPACPYRA